MKHYDIKIEIISPVHIGVDTAKIWKEGIDYIVKDNQVIRIDTRSIINSIDTTQLTNSIAQGKSIENLISDNIESFCLNKYAKPAGKTNFRQILPCVLNTLTGKPIIPGSSLKGAIRSVYYKKLKEGLPAPNQVDGLLKKHGSAIQLADAEFNTSCIVSTNIFNFKRQDSPHKEWKNGIGLAYESLKVGDIGYGSIVLKDEEHNGSITDLFTDINRHTYHHLEKECEFFQHDYSNKPEEITNEAVRIKDLAYEGLNTGRFCILRLACGSGFHAITGDHKFGSTPYYSEPLNMKKNRGNNVKPISRKIAEWHDNTGEHFCPMGFIKISLADEKDIKAFNTTREENFKKRTDRIMKERSLKLEIQQKREKERAIKTEYKKLVQDAKALSDNNEYETAKELLTRASALCPTLSDHVEILKNIGTILNSQAVLKEIEKRKATEQKEREDRLGRGIEFLNERYDNGEYKVSDFKGLKNRINNWMKQSGSTSIPQNQYDILKSSVLRIYSATKPRDRKKDWSDAGSGVFKEIAAWTDSETANCIFQAIQETND